MKLSDKLTRRDAFVAVGLVGAGAVITAAPSVHYVSLLGGASELKIETASLQRVAELRFSYILPELFNFTAYARPDPDGEATAIHYPIRREKCEDAAINGCNYSQAAHVRHENVPSDLYLARVGRHYCPLVVPATRQKRRICVIIPDHTYRAYNRFGGLSLYDPELFNHYGFENGNRPYHRLSWFNNPLKLNIFSYLAQNRFEYDVLSHDLVELSPSLLEDYELVILYGHDEYWTQTFRDGIERHLLRGGNLLNLSGNTAYWRVHIDGDVMRINRKDGADLWRKSDPEERVLGGAFVHAGYALPMRFKDDEEGLKNAVKSLDHPDLRLSVGLERLKRRLTGIRVVNVDHPIFEGTGVQAGDWIGTDSKVIIHELDGVPLKRDSTINWTLAKHYPPDLKVYGEAWAIWPSHGADSRVRQTGVIREFAYQGQGRVLSISTVGWARALAWGEKEVVEITSNAIRYLLDLR